jgi:hypothetical protein
MSDDTNERQTMPPPRVPVPKAIQGQPIPHTPGTQPPLPGAQRGTAQAESSPPPRGRPPKADAFDLTCAIAKELKRVDRETRLRILDTLLALMD